MAGQLQKQYFFSGVEKDVRGNRWAEGCIAGNAMHSTVQLGSDASGSLCYEWIRAATYKKVPGMRDDDFSHEAIDFLIRTALYHRELDARTGVVPERQSFLNSIDVAAQVASFYGKDADFKKVDGNDVIHKGSATDADHTVLRLSKGDTPATRLIFDTATGASTAKVIYDNLGSTKYNTLGPLVGLAAQYVLERLASKDHKTAAGIIDALLKDAIDTLLNGAALMDVVDLIAAPAKNRPMVMTDISRASAADQTTMKKDWTGLIGAVPGKAGGDWPTWKAANPVWAELIETLGSTAPTNGNAAVDQCTNIASAHPYVVYRTIMENGTAKKSALEPKGTLEKLGEFGRLWAKQTPLGAARALITRLSRGVQRKASDAFDNAVDNVTAAILKAFETQYDIGVAATGLKAVPTNATEWNTLLDAITGALSANTIGDMLREPISQALNLALGTGYVTLDNELPYKFYQHVHTLWDSAKPDVQIFYKALIQLLKLNESTGLWDEVDFSEEVKRGERDLYRLNLRSVSTSADAVFINTIPLIFGTYNWGQLWYTHGDTGKVTAVSLAGVDWEQKKNQEILRNIYKGVQNAVVPKGARSVPITVALYGAKTIALTVPATFDLAKQVHNFGDGSTPGYWGTDEQQLQTNMYEILSKIASGGDSVEAPEEGDVLVDANRSLYKYIDGKLNVMTDGEYKPYDVKDGYADNLCTALAINGKPAECHDFVQKCLASGDARKIDDCTRLLQSDMFKGKTMEDVKKMHPQMAYAFLSSYGFQISKIYDNEAERKIWKVERVRTWLARIKGDYPDVYRVLQNHNNVRQYFEWVRTLVNTYPLLIKRNEAIWRGKTDEAMGHAPAPAIARQLGLSSRHAPAVGTQGIMAQVPRLLAGNVARMTAYFPAVPATFSHTGGGQVGGGQVGGLRRPYNSITPRRETVYAEMAEKRQGGATLLRKIFEEQVREIEGMGKRLSDATKTKFTKVFTDLEAQERTAIEIAVKIGKLARIQTFYQDYRQDEFNESKLNEYVREHQHVIDSKSDLERDATEGLAKLAEYVLGPRRAEALRIYASQGGRAIPRAQPRAVDGDDEESEGLPM
jgi:hypothetical protein